MIASVSVWTESTGSVVFQDAYWQDAPVWRQADEWATSWMGEGYDQLGNLSSGIAIRAAGSAQRPAVVCVRVALAGEVESGLRQVAVSHLYLSGIAELHAEGSTTELTLDEGVYRCEVWVDADSPEQVQRVWLMLADRESRGNRSIEELVAAASGRA